MRPFAALVATAVLSAAGLRAQALDWSPLPDRACWLVGSQSGAVTFDALRQRHVVLLGNLFGTGMRTWTRSQGIWTPRATPTAMAPRHRHAMAYDRGRDRVVLFGGADDFQGRQPRADTWEWDGAVWTAAAPAVSPPPRTEHAMAFDPVSGRVLAVGGYGANFATAIGTWAFDGVSWTQVGNGVVAGPGSAATDFVRGVVVWCSSNGASLAEWNGTAWTGFAPSPHPSLATTLCEVPGTARVRAHSAGQLWDWNGTQWTSVAAALPDRVGALLHDSASGLTLMLGGADNSGIEAGTVAWNGTTVRRGEPGVPYFAWSAAQDWVRNRTVVLAFDEPTMEWDGQEWHVGPPAPVFSAPLVFDPLRGVTVMASPQPIEWNGVQWQQRTSILQPTIRAATFHHGRAVTVGIATAPGTQSGYELWEWNGAQWQSLGPAPGIFPNLGYDLARNRLVDVGNAGSAMQTWEWDGVAWTLTGATMPLLTDLAMAYDPIAHRMVATGGFVPVQPPSDVESGATFTWDGQVWTPLVTAHAPAPSRGGGLVFDPRAQRLIRVGGYRHEPLGGGYYGVSGLLELSTAPVASATDLGAGCAAGATAPRLLAAEASVATPHFALDLDRAAPGVPVLFALGSGDAPLAVGACTIRPALDLLAPATTDGNGIAVLHGNMPNVPSLRGLTVFAQAGVFDGSGPALGVSLSNALRIVVGR